MMALARNPFLNHQINRIYLSNNMRLLKNQSVMARISFHSIPMTKVPRSLNHTMSQGSPVLSKHKKQFNILKKIYILGCSITFGIFVVKSFHNSHKLASALAVDDNKILITQWWLNGIPKQIIYSLGFCFYWPMAIYRHRNSPVAETIFGQIKLNHIENDFTPFQNDSIDSLVRLENEYNVLMEKNKYYHDKMRDLLKVQSTNDLILADPAINCADLIYEESCLQDSERIFKRSERIKKFLEELGVLRVTDCAF